MEKVEKVEREVQGFSAEEIAKFRQWFATFDAEAWDHQFEADVNVGKLDALADRARRDHAAGKSTKL